MEMVEDNLAQKEQFPIRELSARTQVNTVTLRAWERRYGLLKPERTAKGHRLYSDDDVGIIEQILALVARGVPLGKVKPLLESDTADLSADDHDENWQTSIKELLASIELFSATKVQHLIHQSFAQYPVPVCRQRLFEPCFAELAQHDDSGATLGFAESELIRYTALRLNTNVAKNKHSLAVTLIAGHQAPMWSLALIALELSDAGFVVQLLHCPFNVAAAIELADKRRDAYTVFYQDGVWKDKEQTIAAAALVANERLFMCGTAPALTMLDTQERVFSDVKTCLRGLLALQ